MPQNGMCRRAQLPGLVGPQHSAAEVVHHLCMQPVCHWLVRSISSYARYGEASA